MGLYITVLILSFVFAVHANSDRLIVEKCLKDSGIAHHEYMLATSFNRKDVDAKIKCASLCMMKGQNFITKEGTIDIEKTVEQLSHKLTDKEQIIRHVVEACRKGKVNDCDSAYNLEVCINEKFTDISDQH